MLVSTNCNQAATLGQVRFVRWRPAGAALIFLLASVAGVAGNRITNHVTPALVIFAVLVIAGMLVTFALDRRVAKRETASRASSAREGPQVDARGARGIQIGDRNRQENYFGTGTGAGE
jgi:hypothetical protein